MRVIAVDLRSHAAGILVLGSRFPLPRLRAFRPVIRALRQRTEYLRDVPSRFEPQCLGFRGHRFGV
jgi:hypothetical protein